MGSIQDLTAPFATVIERGALLVILITVSAKIWISYRRFKQHKLDEPRCSPQLSTLRALSK